MTKRFLSLAWASGLVLATLGAYAQTPVPLGSGTSYTENFDGLANGLPAGFGVYTGATATSLGTAATPTLTPAAFTYWTNASAGFKNYASANLGSSTTTATQLTAADRALGVRQTAAVGDPGASFVFQVANTTNRAAFTLNFKLQSLDASSARVTTWVVDYALASAPTTFIQVATGTTGGSAFTNTPITASFGAALNNQSGPVTIRVSTLMATTNTGNRPSSAIDDWALSWGSTSAPQLVVSPTSLAFSSQAAGSSSAAKTYLLTGANLTATTTLTASGPFAISKSGSTGSFGSTLTYSVSELASPQTVYVQFVPALAGPFGALTGAISHSSGTATATVALSGSTYDPTNTVFNFDGCTSATEISDGWLQYSVTGAQIWACTTFGHDRTSTSTTASAPYGVQINGYLNGNVDNEDWLISPGLNLSAQTNPTLTFWARSAFVGPGLQVRVSTTYSGSGDPNLATWTTLNAILPATGSDVWTQVGGLDLNAFKASRVYVALVYTSYSSGANAGASRWTVDDISVLGQSTVASPALAISPGVLNFGNRAVGSTGTQTFTLSSANLTGNVTVNSSSSAFLVAKSGGTFASSITLTPAELAGPTTLQVRFAPGTTGLAYTGTLTATTAGAPAATIQLSGDAYDLSSTLEVADWNMEWFGSDPASNLGPANKVLQQANATQVLIGLNADVYALEEVVSLTRLQQVVADLSTATGKNFAYQVSDFGSYADDANDVDYPADQKLAFVYNTAVVTNPTFEGLLRCTQAQNCDAWNAWASGRFPYMMTATVTLNGVAKQVRFINVHAKAETSSDAYDRRVTATRLLKNLLDTQYGSDNFVILGDFNDVLSGTVTTGQTVSSYNLLVQDPANYVPLTLPLANAGAQSTVSYPTVIDNDVASNEMAAYYIPGSAAVRTDLANQVASYGSTTSDHYPVYTRYSFAAPDLVISAPNQLVLNGIYNSITVMGSGSGTVQAPVAVNTTVTVQSGGRLDTNCQPITGSGNFTVAAGGTLGICDAAGITATGSTGAVQVTGTRSFSPAASYVYNGTTTQVTGAGLPSQVVALTTTNASTLTLSQPLAVAQTLTVAGSGNLALNSQALTLRSDATGTALVVNSGTGAVTGMATVQRYLGGGSYVGPGYRQLAAPVSGATVSSLATASFSPTLNPAYNTSAAPTTVSPFPTVFGYNENRLTSTSNNLALFDKGWFSPASTADALTVGKGYTVNLAANQTVNFTGTLNNGISPQTLTRQYTATGGGWQLLGNPYPAPLDYSLVAAADRTNLDAAIYVYQPTGQYVGTYRSYVNQIGNPVVPLGQGFFTRVTQGQASGTLTLRNTHRVTTYATQVSVQRPTADARPQLNLTLGTPGGSLDNLYVYAEADATTGFDAGQDAAKLPNPTGLNLAALTSDGQPLSIQGLPALGGRVALQVQVPAAGSYAFTAAELLNLPAGASFVLEDVLTGQRTPLVVGTSYSFTATASGSLDGRFWLDLSGATPLATQAGALQAALTLYPNPTHDGQATLLVPAGTAAGQVQVLDALGRLVRQQPLAAGGRTTLQLADLPAGLYVIRVQAGSEQATRRLTIN